MTLVGRRTRLGVARPRLRRRALVLAVELVDEATLKGARARLRAATTGGRARAPRCPVGLDAARAARGAARGAERSRLTRGARAGARSSAVIASLAALARIRCHLLDLGAERARWAIVATKLDPVPFVRLHRLVFACRALCARTTGQGAGILEELARIAFAVHLGDVLARPVRRADFGRVLKLSDRTSLARALCCDERDQRVKVHELSLAAALPRGVARGLSLCGVVLARHAVQALACRDLCGVRAVLTRRALCAFDRLDLIRVLASLARSALSGACCAVVAVKTNMTRHGASKATLCVLAGWAHGARCGAHIAGEVTNRTVLT